MKLALFVLLLLALFTSCGDDGESGEASIAIDWVGRPNYYDDTNPAIPQVFYPGQYYHAVVGTFTFLYEAWDASVWSGSYTVSLDPGEDGGFFPWDDGEDGEDKYFTLWLLSTGPYFESSALVPLVEEERMLASVPTVDQRHIMEKKPLPARIARSAPTSSLSVQEFKAGIYHIRLEYYRHDTVSQ